ncbi:hypothetical protein FQR65_LT12308 [Abscondita terminalis]|nr:hypothetical protein FQR65_LT12308 [Abscondita terminalis]
MEEAKPSIRTFFSNKTVFITGGTGFLGKVLVEKLLRACHDLKKIYVLARAKKGKSCEKRLEEFFASPLYDRLRDERAEAMSKLFVVSGDCELVKLGLNDADYALLAEEVEVVFHVAATVRFDEKLKKAAYVNVRATRDLLELGRRMRKLEAFVHVSTAFSFCPQELIDEKFYKVSVGVGDLLAIVEGSTDDHLEKITPLMCKPWPNTYTFTKAIAEDVIKNEAGSLPIAVVRPSVVIGSLREPFEGWIDNIYGPTGIFLGISMGMVRTCVYQDGFNADQVPVDFVVNQLISAAWNLGVQQTRASIPIYNCVSSTDNPITWGESRRLSHRYANEFPSIQMKWHPVFQGASDLFSFKFLHWILHLLPAYFGDFLLALSGKKPMVAKMYGKLEKTVTLVSYFTTRQWLFKNDNTKNLLANLDEEDRKIFGFNMKEIDWDAYASVYVKGARKYLLKESIETLPQARSKAFKLKLAHNLLVTVLLYLFFSLLLRILRF